MGPLHLTYNRADDALPFDVEGRAVDTGRAGPAASDARSSRSVRQKAEPPLRRNEPSGVASTR